MEKEFVNYTEALALKELGFDEDCLGIYYIQTWNNNKPVLELDLSIEYTCITINAPLYQQAFSFLLNLLSNVSIHYFNDGSGNLKRIGEPAFFDFNNRKECLIELINQVKKIK